MDIPVQKGKQVQDAQTGHNMPVHLGHELELRGLGQRREVRRGRLGSDLALGLELGIGVLMGTEFLWLRKPGSVAEATVSRDRGQDEPWKLMANCCDVIAVNSR